MIRSLTVAALAALSVTSTASAAGIYVEDFSGGAANWTQNNNNTAAVAVSSGGPLGTGDAFIQTSFALTTAVAGTPVVVRATGSNNASGGAFTGSYASVDTVSFYVKHNASVALPIGLRLGGTTPGTAIIVQAPLTQPNVWTLLTFELDPANPDIISYEGTSGATNEIKFNAVIGAISNFQAFLNLAQAGYVAPAAGESVTFSLDAATVPEPTTAVMALPALALLGRRRRA